MSKANESSNRKQAKEIRLVRVGGYQRGEEFFQFYDYETNELIETPPGWNVKKRNMKFGHCMYAILHDAQSDYIQHEVLKEDGLVIVNLKKSEVTKTSDKKYSAKWSWLGEEVSWSNIKCGIWLGNEMQSGTLSVKRVAPPQNVVGTVFEVKASGSETNVQIKSKVKHFLHFVLFDRNGVSFFFLFCFDRLSL